MHRPGLPNPSLPLKTPLLQIDTALGHELTDKRLDILRRIGSAGSISEAARAVGISYKAAWQAIDTLSNLAQTPLLERTVGGTGGGGARLTPAGQHLLQAADLMQQARTQVLQQLAGGHHPPPLVQPTLLGLRTSMRNLLPGTVVALQAVRQAVLVELALPDGQALYARITHESAELLGLAQDQPVLALCKATAVAIGATKLLPNASFGLNHLNGKATRVSRVLAGGEVSMALGAGLSLVGFASDGHGLRKGTACTARLDESAVVIALSG